MEQITITVDQEGQAKVAVTGVAGVGCQALTADIEAALGETVSDEKTREFHAHVGQQAGQAATNRGR